MQVVGLGVMPLLLLTSFIVHSASRGILAIDVRTGYLPAAHALVHGVSPYPGATYPPFGLALLVPFTGIPGPEIVLTVIAVALVPAVLLALDVRDWRCYGAVFLWFPVLSAIQTVNLTLPLVLAAALCWRWRDRTAAAGWAAGLSVAAKLISAPLIAWLIATRRVRSAVICGAVALAVTLGLFAVIEATAGGSTSSFVERSREVPAGVNTPSYSPIDIVSSFGLSRIAGAAVAGAIVVVLCGLSIHLGRSGDDRRSFAAAAIAIIFFAPNVWLHSLAFLMLPLGVLRPRFDVLWLVPVALVVSVGDPSTWEWLLLWSTCALVIVTALVRPTSPRSREPRPAPPVAE